MVVRVGLTSPTTRVRLGVRIPLGSVTRFFLFLVLCATAADAQRFLSSVVSEEERDIFLSGVEERKRRLGLELPFRHPHPRLSPLLRCLRLLQPPALAILFLVEGCCKAFSKDKDSKARWTWRLFLIFSLMSSLSSCGQP